MKSKPLKILVIFGISIIFVIGLLAFLTYGDNNSETLSWSFEDLQLNALVKNPEITCSIYQQLTVVDAKGNQVNRVTSSKLSDNPTLDLTAVTSGNPIAGTNSAFFFNCIGNTAGGDISVDPSSITLRVKGQKTEGGSYSMLLQKSVTTNKVLLPKGSSTAKEIGFIGFYGKDIEASINPTKKFQSKMVFEVSGNIKISYAKYPSVKYTFPIPSASLPVYYTFNVGDKISQTTIDQKNIDQDKDGIIDINDKCATSPENFNGYLDTDGCPDQKPNTPISGPDEPPVNPNTCPSGQVWNKDHCESQSKIFSGKMYLPYSLILDTKTISKSINDQSGIDIPFTLANILSSGGDSKFVKVIVDPVFKLDQGSNLISLGTNNLKYSGIIIDNTGKETTVQGFGTPSDKKMTKDSSGYIHFPPLELTANMLENSLKDKGYTTQETFNLSIRIDGDFNIIDDQTAKRYNGVIQNNAGLSYQFVFDPVKVDPTKPANQEPCQGLSGLEIILCKARIIVTDPNECGNPNNAIGVGTNQYICIDPAATGGYCQGLTSLQCLEKAQNEKKPTPKIPTDTPIGGTDGEPKIDIPEIVICDGSTTIQQCIIDKLPQLPSDRLPDTSSLGIDQTTMILIFLGIVLMIVIIIMIKKRMRKP